MKIRGSLTFKVTRDPAAKRSRDPCMWRRKASWKLRDLEARVPERRMVKVMGTGVNYTPGMSIQTNYEGLPNLPLVSFLVSPSAWNILIILSYLILNLFERSAVIANWNGWNLSRDITKRRAQGNKRKKRKNGRVQFFLIKSLTKTLVRKLTTLLYLASKTAVVRPLTSLSSLLSSSFVTQLYPDNYNIRGKLRKRLE